MSIAFGVSESGSVEGLLALGLKLSDLSAVNLSGGEQAEATVTVLGVAVLDESPHPSLGFLQAVKAS